MKLSDVLSILNKIDQSVKSQNKEDPEVKYLAYSGDKSKLYSQVLTVAYIDDEVRIV